MFKLKLILLLFFFLGCQKPETIRKLQFEDHVLLKGKTKNIKTFYVFEDRVRADVNISSDTNKNFEMTFYYKRSNKTLLVVIPAMKVIVKNPNLSLFAKLTVGHEKNLNPVKQNGSRQILGIECIPYKAKLEKVVVLDACLSSYKNIGLNKDQGDSLASLYSHFTQIYGGDLGNLSGVIVSNTVYAKNGDKVMSSSLTSVTSIEVEENLFALPSGYQILDFKDFDQSVFDDLNIDKLIK